MHDQNLGSRKAAVACRVAVLTITCDPRDLRYPDLGRPCGEPQYRSPKQAGIEVNVLLIPRTDRRSVVTIIKT
jgi:hypothetical protein